MKYDCDLIRDIAPLYKDSVLSDRGKEIADEHLSECTDCQKYYSEYSDEAISILETTDKAKEEIAFAKKIKTYRMWQIGLFIVSLLLLLTMTVPWFGYVGITEIAGTAVLRHPVAIIGIGLFFLAIWHNHRKASMRLWCGYMGWGLLLATVVYDFLTLPLGSILGFQAGPFNFDIPFFPDFRLSKSFEYALPGFYVGLAMILLAGIAFFLFGRKLKSTGIHAV